MENQKSPKRSYMTYPNGREVVTFSIDRENYNHLSQIADLKEIRITTAINYAIASFIETSQLEIEKE